MNYKLNVHDLIKCLTAPLTDVNHRWLNLHTCSLILCEKSKSISLIFHNGVYYLTCCLHCVCLNK